MCCAVCLLAVSRSDRLYGCNWRRGKHVVTERDQMKTKQKEEYTTPRIIPGTALCSKESTAQHDTATQHQRRARHGTARRCAALLLYIAGLV